jgi:dihydrolipoamide dehydrogenase
VPKSLLVAAARHRHRFASFYRNLGAEVTVVEVLDRILPGEDAEISDFARKAFEKQGIKIITSATVKGLKKAADSVTATIEAGGKSTDQTFDRVVLAIGIVGNVENLGLEGTKVKVEKTHVVIDKWCATGEPGIYAIGDLVGPPWLAHKASHEGVLCVEHIAGVKGAHPLDVSRVPGCTYCMPQVASVGLTEAAAKAAGHEVKIGRFLYRQWQGDRDGAQGLVKTVFDAKTGELLGARDQERKSPS